MSGLESHDLYANTWDYHFKSVNGQEYFNQLAICISTTEEQPVSPDIYYLLSILNTSNTDPLTNNDFVLRWELYRINIDDVLVQGGTPIIFSNGDDIPNIYNFGIDANGKSQITLTFPVNDNFVINSEIESFIFRVYIVKANVDNSFLTDLLSVNTPGDYINTQYRKNNIGYLGGFKINFTFASDLASYTVKLSTIISENIQQKYVSIADYFQYHSNPDVNGVRQNENIFGCNGLTKDVARSELVNNLGAMGTSISFYLNNIDKRINTETNHTSFADVYGSNPSNFSITYWQIRLKLCEDLPVIGSNGEQSTVIGNTDVNGWQWQWNNGTPNLNHITYSNEEGLTIMSPFYINLSTATFDGSGNSLIEWTTGDKLNLLSRSNFYMIFEHTFGLEVSYNRNSKQINLIMLFNMFTKNQKIIGIKDQSTVINVMYANTTLNVLQQLYYNIYRSVYNRQNDLVVPLVITIVLLMINLLTS